MENMILIDLETRDFSVHTGGIYEVGALAVSNGQILEKLHLGIIEDESLISRGYGYGYEDLSHNTEIINKFKSFISKYQFPLVAHNAPFDRKFLLHFNWIDSDYPVYDSIRAFKQENLNLPSYSLSILMDYCNIHQVQSHTALDDTEVLFKIIEKIKPSTWLPIGSKTKSKKGYSPYGKLDSLKQDFDIIKNIFDGQTIVFTGKSSHSRNTLIELAKKAGAIANSNNITKKTDILVVGDDCGSKLEKAQKMGIQIITMDDFHKMVNNIELEKSLV